MITCKVNNSVQLFPTKHPFEKCIGRREADKILELDTITND